MARYTIYDADTCAKARIAGMNAQVGDVIRNPVCVKDTNEMRELADLVDYLLAERSTYRQHPALHRLCRDVPRSATGRGRKARRNRLQGRRRISIPSIQIAEETAEGQIGGRQDRLDRESP